MKNKSIESNSSKMNNNSSKRKWAHIWPHRTRYREIIMLICCLISIADGSDKLTEGGVENRSTLAANKSIENIANKKNGDLLQQHDLIKRNSNNYYNDKQKIISEISNNSSQSTAVNSSDKNPINATNANYNEQKITIDEDSMKLPLYMRILATLACLIIFTIGVSGNCLVPLVVIKTKYLRNSTNLFLINLSMADLLLLIVSMPTVFIELHSRPETWLLGEAMCKYFICFILVYSNFFFERI